MSWRGRVGIVLPDNSDCDDDYYAMAPTGVTVHMSRHDAPFLEHPVASHTAHLERGYIERAARQLAPVHCDAVGYASVSCSFAGGSEYDRRIIATIEAAAGCPATTGTTAMLAGLKSLHVSRIGVVSPYERRRNVLFQEILAAAGFSIVSFEVLRVPADVRRFYECLGLYRLRHIRGPELAYRLGRRADRPEAQAILIGSTNFRTGPMIESLEQDLGKPVVTANQALMWHTLRLAGVREAIPGFGRLSRVAIPEN